MISGGLGIENLAQSMMYDYQSVYKRSLKDRTLGGVTREITWHYLPDTWFRENMFAQLGAQILLDHTNPADIEGSDHGSKTWMFFEYVWNW